MSDGMFRLVLASVLAVVMATAGVIALARGVSHIGYIFTIGAVVAWLGSFYDYRLVQREDGPNLITPPRVPVLSQLDEWGAPTAWKALVVGLLAAGLVAAALAGMGRLDLFWSLISFPIGMTAATFLRYYGARRPND